MAGHKDRDHALLSASGAHRWLACPPSALLGAQFPEEETDAAREGTLAHELCEIKLKNYFLCRRLWQKENEQRHKNTKRKQAVAE